MVAIFNITPEELKLVAKEISYNIINIRRVSYMLGKYPTKWKIVEALFIDFRKHRTQCHDTSGAFM